MKVIGDVCIIPLGVGVSLSPYVALCEQVFADYDLEVVLHANGTNLAGEWDEVNAAIKACHERLHREGVPRISTSIRLGTRSDRQQTMADKVVSVREKMEECG